MSPRIGKLGAVYWGCVVAVLLLSGCQTYVVGQEIKPGQTVTIGESSLRWHVPSGAKVSAASVRKGAAPLGGSPDPSYEGVQYVIEANDDRYRVEALVFDGRKAYEADKAYVLAAKPSAEVARCDVSPFNSDAWSMISSETSTSVSRVLYGVDPATKDFIKVVALVRDPQSATRPDYSEIDAYLRRNFSF